MRKLVSHARQGVGGNFAGGFGEKGLGSERQGHEVGPEGDEVGSIGVSLQIDAIYRWVCDKKKSHGEQHHTRWKIIICPHFEMGFFLCDET